MAFGHALMTPAEGTQAFAKWQVDIQAHAFALIGFIKRLF